MVILPVVRIAEQIPMMPEQQETGEVIVAV
jgi:hypothetical protein